MEPTFLEALIEWQQSGNRCLNITIDSLQKSGEIRVWCYDYDVMAGTNVMTTDELQTMNLAESRKKQIMAELAKLELQETKHAYV